MKIKRTIIGVVMTVMLLGSLMAVATPASALTLGWGNEDLPFDKTLVQVETVGDDIIDIAIADDGSVIYAATGATNGLYRSTDTGKTWAQIDTDNNTDFIAVAPDDTDWIAYVDNVTQLVYISEDAGASWDALPAIADATDDLEVIYDLAVSATRSDVHYVAVAGADTDGVGADVFVFNVGASVPAWTSKADDTGRGATGTDSAAVAVAFSPNYASDKVMTAVTVDSGDPAVYYEVYSFDSSSWNDSAAFTDDYPASLTTEAGISFLSSASIALAPDYLGSDDGMRLAFVGVTIQGSAASEEDSGVYRLDDDSASAIRGDRRVHSIAYDGTNLVAGRWDGLSVYRSDNPLATSPTFKTSATLKSPSGVNMTQVGWAGDDVVAATSGDESAFSISRDNGKAFNSISLIDTEMTILKDVAVSADGSKIFLSSNDGADFSLWRYDSNWERVLSVQAVTNFLVRVAPDDSDVVYVGTYDGTTMYYTADAGETRWQSRVAKVAIRDLVVESSDIIYAIRASDGQVARSTNSGFTWGGRNSSELTSGNTLISLGEDKLLAGSQNGYVSYSTDGGSTFTLLDDDLGDNVVAAATGTDAGDFVFAASDTANDNLYYWELGSDDSWDDTVAVGAGYEVTGMVYFDGILYASASHNTTDDSKHMRTTNPTGSTVYWRTETQAGKSFGATPSALKTSSTTDYTKLWALATDDDQLRSYKDTLVHTVPTLLKPVDGFNIGHYREAGKAETVLFTWENPSDNTKGYDVVVALDEGFDEVVVDGTLADEWDEGDIVSQTIGADSVGVLYDYGWQPGQTYYWRVRVDSAESRSGWSEVRTVVVDEEEAPVPPAPPVKIEIPPTPKIELPQPKVTITVPPPTEVKIPPAPPPPPQPAPITPAYIWATIIIGAVLVIALIILILRTRRV